MHHACRTPKKLYFVGLYEASGEMLIMLIRAFLLFEGRYIFYFKALLLLDCWLRCQMRAQELTMLRCYLLFVLSRAHCFFESCRRRYMSSCASESYAGLGLTCCVFCAWQELCTASGTRRSHATAISATLLPVDLFAALYLQSAMRVSPTPINSFVARFTFVSLINLKRQRCIQHPV